MPASATIIVTVCAVTVGALAVAAYVFGPALLDRLMLESHPVGRAIAAVSTRKSKTPPRTSSFKSKPGGNRADPLDAAAAMQPLAPGQDHVAKTSLPASTASVPTLVLPQGDSDGQGHRRPHDQVPRSSPPSRSSSLSLISAEPSAAPSAAPSAGPSPGASRSVSLSASAFSLIESTPSSGSLQMVSAVPSLSMLDADRPSARDIAGTASAPPPAVPPAPVSASASSGSFVSAREVSHSTSASSLSSASSSRTGSSAGSRSSNTTISQGTSAALQGAAAALGSARMHATMVLAAPGASQDLGSLMIPTTVEGDRSRSTSLASSQGWVDVAYHGDSRTDLASVSLSTSDASPMPSPSMGALVQHEESD
ncbi:hypothetical protein HK105_205858 [Polyrhizophydium stewartii]|uniref:Uncharacterized protein n=1 Tax=Polyrhizophydium stewartii TaxID=2732419 RepID=A0ABR4N4X2_9FUNG|nr:hypothetical protein HK105_002673 [Polyrhizophydium stewartii]